MTAVILILFLSLALAIDWQLEKRKLHTAAVPNGAGSYGPRLIGMPVEAKARVREHFKQELDSKDIYYHPGHAWLRRLDDQVVEAGADEISGKLLGAISEVDLPAVGTQLRQGATAWTLRSGELEISQPSPVSGTVVKVNTAIKSQPGAVNSSPYR